jgi:hypothetical protein
MRSVYALVFGLLFCFQVSGQSNSAVAGVYAEARSGEVYTCGCLFSSEMASGGREAILAWEIRDGEYRGTPLAGLTTVAVIVGTDNLGLTAANRRSVLYIDSGSTPSQREAVVELLSHNYGPVLGEIIAVHTVPVSLQKTDGQTHVTVGDIVSVVLRDARLPQDAHAGSYRWYEPFVPLKAPTLSTTLYYSFQGPDFQREWWSSEPGISSYTGDFVLTR